MADIVIIGAGPAGVFAALELVRDAQGLDVVMVEQGKDIPSRSRSTGDIMQGWGGAGAFSDGKLTLSAELGGDLSSLVPEKELMGLVEEVDTTYLRYSAPNKVFELSPDNAEKISARAKLAGLMYIPTRIRHIGTENCYTVLKNMRDYLDDKLEIIFNTKVMEIVSHEGRVNGVRLEDGRLREARYVIVAPGRAGSAWMASQAASLGIDAWPNPVDLGVRVELPAVTMEELTSMAYETKFIYYSRTFDDRVRTFCMNPYGEVVKETADNIVTVNGHSWASRRSENTNFAILVSANFTEPFDDPIGYGRSVAAMANMLGSGVIVQRLGDLISGRRTTDERLKRSMTEPTLKDATPGDLSYCIPYRILTDIVEMLEALDKMTPGINTSHTLLYGVEVKFYSNRIRLNNDLSTDIDGLFVVGDGAGITRGLVQASCSGLIAARAIKKAIA